MCFFDSPVGRCEAVKEMVLLDETQAECAREHGCPPGRKCPLAGCFTPVSGLSEDHVATLVPPPRRRRAARAVEHRHAVLA